MSAAEVGDDESPSRRNTSSTAQRRWRLLARALTHSPNFEDEISVRRFTTFSLLDPVYLENSVVDDPESTWWEYSSLGDEGQFEVQIRRINKTFTANELIGFNNTGNVCVWPSEECLAYYLLKNRAICRNRNVLELGGGMSCLAGIMAAKYCNPSSITLTDGNVTSVDNVRCTVARNGLADSVRCGVVQWARAAKAFRQAATAAAGNNGNRVQVIDSDLYSYTLIPSFSSLPYKRAPILYIIYYISLMAVSS